ncbi:hypothetical protein NDU88_001809 [Pleurodeles waltl]|uniref:Uncharacterized protein n=1 Tax=Pleurodeles waltl TaxID=8319 RepID=A0AAV7P4W5_PLEWA|nr:hypothetical protein NDU88_001809 [Pleurodeles waltl]
MRRQRISPQLSDDRIQQRGDRVPTASPPLRPPLPPARPQSFQPSHSNLLGPRSNPRFQRRSSGASHPADTGDPGELQLQLASPRRRRGVGAGGSPGPVVHRPAPCPAPPTGPRQSTRPYQRQFDRARALSQPRCASPHPRRGTAHKVRQVKHLGNPIHSV